MDAPYAPPESSPDRRDSISWVHVVLAIFCIVGVLVALAVPALNKVRTSSRQKAMLGNLRQLSAATDQYFLEEPYRVFVNYDDVVGSTRYIKAVNSVAGEDYRPLFPRRPDWDYEVVTPDGLSAKYNPIAGPLPPDGTQVEELTDGRRLETAWKGGQRHGPFRAFYPDGKLWSEATLDHGRVLEAWLYTPRGRKFDELTQGAEGVAAIHEDLTAITAGRREAAAAKFAAQDFSGAIAEYTAALEVHPTDLSLYRGRALAKRGAGDLDGAIADLATSERIGANWMHQTDLPGSLREVLHERARQNRAAGNTTEAENDFRTLALSATYTAEKRLGSSDWQGADQVLDESIELYPVGEAHALRGHARRLQGRFAEAEADYTQAIALVGKNVVRAPAMVGFNSRRWPYYRAHVRRMKGDLAGAEQDFGTVVSLAADSTLQANAGLWRFIVQCEQGRAVDAARDLAALPKEHWEAHRLTAAYLLGEIPEAQLPANPETLVITGMFERLRGNTSGARDRLRRARGAGDFQDVDGQAAALALNGLESAP